MTSNTVADFKITNIKVSDGGDNSSPRLSFISNNTVAVTWTNVLDGQKNVLVREFNILSESLSTTTAIPTDRKKPSYGAFPMGIKSNQGFYPISWTEEGSSGSDLDIYTQIYQNAVFAGQKKRISSSGHHLQEDIRVTESEPNRLAIVWTSQDIEGGDRTLYLDEVTIKENLDLTNEKPISLVVADGDNKSPKIDSLEEGKLVLAFVNHYNNQDTVKVKIFANSTIDGSRFISEFTAHQAAGNALSSFYLTSLENKFITSWIFNDGSKKDVFAQIRDSSGSVVVDTTQITRDQDVSDARIYANGNQSFALSWLANERLFVRQYDLSIQQYGSDCTFADVKILDDNYDLSFYPANNIALTWVDKTDEKAVHVRTGSLYSHCHASVTKSGSGSKSVSHSKSVTATDTHSRSMTETGTGSVSLDVTTSGSLSISGSKTKSHTNSNTGSHTNTKSATLTVSHSDSGSKSLTDSKTHSATSSISQTVSRSGSGSQTITNSGSQSGSHSISISNSATKSVTDTTSGSISHSSTGSQTITDSGSQSDSFTISLSNSATKSATATISDSVSHSNTASRTITDSSTESSSGTESLSHSASGSISSSTSGTVSGSGTITLSDSNSKSASVSRSNSATDTKTVSQTSSGSKTDTATKTSSATVSDSYTVTTSGSLSNSDSVTNTKSQTKSSTDTSSQTVSGSRTITKSGSKTASSTGTDLNTNTMTITGTGTDRVTETQTNTVTETMRPTTTNTITLECGKDEHGVFADPVSLEVYVKNIKVKHVDSASPSTYSLLAHKKLENKISREITYKPELEIEYEPKDYINNFDEYLINNPGFVINGTIHYSNEVLDSDIVFSQPGFLRYGKSDCNKEQYTSYNLLDRNLRYYGVQKSYCHPIKVQQEIPVSLDRCYIATMKAEFNKNVKVHYDAEAFIEVTDKFGNKLHKDSLISARECLLNHNIAWELVNGDRLLKASISGIMTHTALQNVDIAVDDCTPKLPHVDVTLVYRDYQLSVPSNLGSYNTIVSSGRHYVNAKNKGPIDIDSTLSLNLQLTNSMEGFKRDIKSNEYVKSGRVLYANEYNNDVFAHYNGVLTGYKVDDSKHSLEFDWFSSEKDISTNVLSPWDSVVIEDVVKSQVAANQCINPIMEASIYKDIPVSYTAKAHFVAKDEGGYVLTGEKLQAVATSVLNKPFTISGDQVIFDVAGTIKHNIVHKVETSVRECSEASALQSDSKLPQVHVSLTYRDFQLTPPTDFAPYNTTLVSSSRVVNSKEQGKTEFDVPITLNLKLGNSMDSFHKDIKSSELIKEGKIKFIREYNNNAHLAHSNEISGYQIDARQHAQSLEFDWFSSQGTITSNILSQWDTACIKHTAKVDLLANQCAESKIVGYLYKDIPVPYTATAYFTAKDENGYSITGNKLKAVAESTFNHPVNLINDHEITFATTGVLKHNILHNVESSLRDCYDSPLQLPLKLPKVKVSLTYRDFILNVPIDINQLMQSNKLKINSIVATEKVFNNKKYGNIETKTPIALEVQLPQAINSFYDDIKPNDLVIDGEVTYLRKFEDIQLLFNNDLTKQISGYKVSSNLNAAQSHTWFDNPSKVSSGILSSWDKLDITNEIVTKLVPNQCSIITMKANLYENVKVEYSAKGYFTAKDENDYPLTGEKLVAIAQNIFDKDVTLNSNGEVEFITTGELTHSLVGDIETNIEDCNG